jgi:predicted P-loop ATPase
MLGDASKELVLSLAGKAVCEIGEMGMRGSANAALVKKMVSAQFDEGRPAYGRAVVKRQRRNIFIGTTNEDEPLTDPTGNRRFQPVRIDCEIDLAWLRANIGQVIGEAAAQHSRGVSFALPQEVWADATKRQNAARSESDIETMLTEWFGREVACAKWSYVTAADLIRLTDIMKWRQTSLRGLVMRRLGYWQANPWINGERLRVWVRGPQTLPKWIDREGARFNVGLLPDGRARVTVVMGVGV